MIITIFDNKFTGFYKFDYILIHGRLGKFTDEIHLYEALAGFHIQRTCFGSYNNLWKNSKLLC